MAHIYLPYAGPVVTRAEAKASGAKRYFTGKACRNGHLDERYTSQNGCLACSMASTWQAEHRDQFAAYASEYRKANKDRIGVRVKAWRIANRDQFDARAAAWQKANRPSINAKQTEWKKANAQLLRVARHAWVAANKDHIRALRKALSDANPHRARCYVETRRARKLSAGGTYTPEQIANLAVSQRNKCINCHASIEAKYEIDHIVALVNGGSNGIHNIQLLCMPCNRAKHTKCPIAWAQENGRLL